MMEKLKSNFCQQPCQLKNQIVMMPQPWLKSKVARKCHIHAWAIKLLGNGNGSTEETEIMKICMN